MESFLQVLEQELQSFSSFDEATGLCVGFSGGLDSTVLLTGLVRLKADLPVRALHVDHGLHSESAQWSAHCARVSEDLGIEFHNLSVKVDLSSGQGPEASAREVRYAALAQSMRPAEILLTAHHGDDQLETVLLRLLRGSGVKGLRGMASLAPFGPGYLGRPLLGLSRAVLHETAMEWDLSWLEDPSNPDSRFDRNYLRREVIPLLEQRWPGARAVVCRSARQMTAAQQILESVAEDDAARIGASDRISQRVLLELAPPRRANLLRYLIPAAGLPVPDARQLRQLLQAIEVTRPDAQTQVQWPGGEARIYRGQVHLLEPLQSPSEPGYSGCLAAQSPWQGPEGRVELYPSEGPGIPDSWVQQGLTVRFRVGGERFRPLESAHSRALKKCLQSAGVVPWMRSRIPLLYHDSNLVAVGDLWFSDQIRSAEIAEPSWRVCWSEHPSAY